MTEEIKFLLEGVSFNERPSEFKPTILQHSYHLMPGETNESKPETTLPKHLSHYLKPWELLEELLQNSFNSSTAFFEVFNEFPALTEDDIFECVVMMSNTYPILEDATQRMIMNVYSNTKSSKFFRNNLKKIFCFSVFFF